MGASNSQLEHLHPNFAILKSTNKSPSSSSSSFVVFFVCLVFRVWSSRVSRVQQPEGLRRWKLCSQAQPAKPRKSGEAVWLLEARLTAPAAAAAAARSCSSVTACQTTREKTRKTPSSTLQQTQGVSNHWAALGCTLVHTLKQRSFLDDYLFNSLTRTNLHYKHWHLSIHFPSAQTCVCVCVCGEFLFHQTSLMDSNLPTRLCPTMLSISVSHVHVDYLMSKKKFEKAYQQKVMMIGVRMQSI